MSKRFGRNQKRAMQAELTLNQERLVQVENSRAYFSGALRETQQQLRSFEALAKAQDEYERALFVISTVLDVVRDVCPDSCALQSARVIPDSTWVVERHEPMVINLSSTSQPPELYDIRRLDLYQLEIELMESDPFRDALEFRVDLRNQRGRIACAGYRHTPAALARMSAGRIAKDLAPHVEQLLKERFG